MQPLHLLNNGNLTDNVKRSIAMSRSLQLLPSTCLGLPVSVRIKYHDHEHLELDCVDKINTKNQTLHLNRFGWFSFDGTFIDDETMHSEANISDLVLNKPCKKTMTAACSGHCWNHKGKLSPRALSLRELLLSTLINWKTFTYSGKPQFI